MSKHLTPKIHELRHQNMSYSKIAKLLGCSQSTVSLACKDLPGNEQMKARLIKEENAKPNKGFEARAAAKKYYAKQRQEAIAHWTQQIESYPDRNFVHYMAGLYDGEGRHSNVTFSLSNSDPAILRTFLDFVEVVCKETPKSIGLYLHASHNKDICLAWWLEHGVPITKVYQIDTRTQKRDYTNKGNQGTVIVYASKPQGLYESLQRFSYAYNTALPARTSKTL